MQKNLNDTLKEASTRLGALSDERLAELVEKNIEWFGLDEEAETDPDIQSYMDEAREGDREAKIGFLMNGDPIAAEGGVLDFLVTEGVLS